MPNYTIIRRITLQQKHIPTGRTRHFIGNQKMPTPHGLIIAQYPDNPGYYLFYMDEVGNEMTDTYHETLEDAFDQAAWEFQVSHEDWEG